MKNGFLWGLMVAMFLLLPACEELDDKPDDYLDDDKQAVAIPLNDVAALLSELKIGPSQIREVYNAVTSSSWNGYDEEYMMQDLFREPGAGVGDDALPQTTLNLKREKMVSAGIATVSGEYTTPLKTLIEERVHERQNSTMTAYTRADGTIITAAQYLVALQNSDIQIYWPYSEDWDGEAFPIITYDPNDGSTTNIGYQLSQAEDGESVVREIIVTEEIAMANPVWVINRNDDSIYTSLDLLRMQDPDWGTGGDIIVKPPRRTPPSSDDDGNVKTLILRDFKMLRNYDPWFAGASEFFVKIGSVEDFTASTEAELQVYVPAITDFMIVVKRKYVNQTIPFNAVLVSEWTEQLTNCAFMIIEDDGGKRTSWKCSAVVKINSKSYGIEIELPFNTRDDIVWRGQLSRKYIIANNGITGHFGDVDLTFEIVEY